MSRSILLSIAASALAVQAHQSHKTHGGGGHGVHDHMGPLNPILGTHGYPDCTALSPPGDDVEANQFNMVCHQVVGAPTALKVACVGDSITAGAHSSGPNFTYPAQLQSMLDPAQYSVTNLGACGSTMQVRADSGYDTRMRHPRKASFECFGLP